MARYPVPQIIREDCRFSDDESSARALVTKSRQTEDHQAHNLSHRIAHAAD